jgi:hypothetical protein
MTKEVCYNSDTVTVWYDPDKNIVSHKIHKFVFGEEYQKFLLAGTETLKKHHAKKWLSDDRNNVALREEDIAWGMVNWLPQTVQAGWKYWAIIQPDKVIAQMNMKTLVENFAKEGVITKYFSNTADAEKWLDAQV